MESSEYYLFVTALFALFVGLFGMATSVSIMLASALGIMTIGIVGFVTSAICFLIFLGGSFASYLWFVAALEE